jgi:N-acyl-phosphatidylethanolamine-hydrolysing phospholipase D
VQCEIGCNAIRSSGRFRAAASLRRAALDIFVLINNSLHQTVWWPILRLVRNIPGPQPKNLRFDPARSHHTPTGFRNNYPQRPPTPAEIDRLSAEVKTSANVGPLRVDLSPVAPNLPFLHANRAQPAVTWIGHSTVLMQMGGRNVLTDPIFARRASPVPFAGPKRLQAPGVKLHDLPPIDLVVISHNHYDHLNLASVRALSKQPAGPPIFAVPLGLDQWFRRNLRRLPADRVRVFDWWDTTELAGLNVSLVPTHHWSARTPWNRNQNLWGAWIAETGDGFRFFFSGDLAWSADIADIAERFSGFDLAAIAIGHYEPRWFMKNNHVNPDEAVRVHRTLRAKRSLAIHHGTFARLTLEPLDQPLIDLAGARKAHGVSDEAFFALRHGETKLL